ncbi:MAG: hypothetical protein ABJN40_22995 [Sneathiella sp.]
MTPNTKTWKIACLTAAILSAPAMMTAFSPTPATAALSVIDSSNLAEAIKQINELKKQLDELKKANEFLQKQVDAIGELGKISIPVPNLGKIAGEIRSFAQCMTPDFESLMPSVDMEDVSLGDLCSVSDHYKNTLWITAEEKAKLKGTERLERIEEIRVRRENVLVEAAADGLAHADTALEGALSLNKTAAEIEAAANAADNVNARLAVLAQSQAALIRAQGQTNQLLAQQLRVQSAFALAAGVDVTNELANTEEDEQ